MKRKVLVAFLLTLVLAFTAGLAACKGEGKTYTVSFYEEDGITQVGETQTVKEGAEFTVPEAPNVEGKDFEGWTLDGALYDFEAEGAKRATKNMEFTAQYTKAKVSVTFWFNGELLETKTVEKGERVTAYEFNVPGYTFNFWAKEGAETTQFNFNAKIEENTKLVANATINRYTVTFVDEDGETELHAPQTLDYGSALEVPTAPQKEHKTFIGWTVQGTDKVVDLSAGATVPADNTVYVATYALDKFTVTFYDEDGETVLFEGEFEYGTLPVYGGAAPKKEVAGQKWKFVGFGEIVAVTEDTSYTAHYLQDTTTQESGGDTYDSDKDW